MDCLHARDRLSDLIDGRPDAGDLDEVRAHVAACAACAAESRALSTVSEGLRGLPAPEGSPDLERRTLARLEAAMRADPTEAPTLWMWLTGSVRVPAWVLATVVVLLAVAADRGLHTAGPVALAPAGGPSPALPPSAASSGGPRAPLATDVGSRGSQPGTVLAGYRPPPAAAAIDYSGHAIVMVETPAATLTAAIAILHDRRGRSRVDILSGARDFFLVQDDVVSHFFLEEQSWMTTDYALDLASAAGVGPEGARAIGPRTVAGRLTRGFAWRDGTGDRTTRRWVDVETGLVLRSEVESRPGHLSALSEFTELTIGPLPRTAPLEARPEAARYHYPPGEDLTREPRLGVLGLLRRLSLI